MSFTSLQSQLSARIFGGLADGLSTTITGGQISTLASDSATAAAAIIAALPGVSYPQSAPEVIALRAEQAAAIFAGLASGLVGINGSQITALATTSVACLTAIQSAVTTAIGSASSGAIDQQIQSAVQVFSGLALGLASISGGQITTIAASAAAAAAAIQTAI